MELMCWATGTFTSVTLMGQRKREKEHCCLSHALPGSTALCQGVKRGQKGRQRADEEVRLSCSPCPLTNCLWKFTMSVKLHLC